MLASLNSWLYKGMHDTSEELKVPDSPISTPVVMPLSGGGGGYPFFRGVTKGFVRNIREIHPLDPQPPRYCMLASTASAARVTRCSLGLYWSCDLCSKHALAGWGMASYLGQIVRGSEI